MIIGLTRMMKNHTNLCKLTWIFIFNSKLLLLNSDGNHFGENSQNTSVSTQFGQMGTNLVTAKLGEPLCEWKRTKVTINSQKLHKPFVAQIK